MQALESQDRPVLPTNLSAGGRGQKVQTRKSF
eukprot:UN12992